MMVIRKLIVMENIVFMIDLLKLLIVVVLVVMIESKLVGVCLLD